MDGIPVAEFVTTKYPRLRRNPDYRPVGAAIDCLQKAPALPRATPYRPAGLPPLRGSETP